MVRLAFIGLTFMSAISFVLIQTSLTGHQQPSEPPRAQPPVNLTQPKVCVLIPATSMGQPWQTIDDSFLVNVCLPSILKTSESEKYQYVTYVGFDSGDSFFDNATTTSALYEWANQSHMELRLLDFFNPMHKPGPVMNLLAAVAYREHCDFTFRINDDTEMLGEWTTPFIQALLSFDPPLRGVVGPTCHEGNTAILTHDFVHRTHMNVFGNHYPPQLTDWWLDDWISLVYGESNTLKHPNVTVKHHVKVTRYSVTYKNEEILQTLVLEGAKRLRK